MSLRIREKIRGSKHCETITDIIANNTFAYLATMPIELFIAWMDFSEHIRTRLAWVVTNTITARPYWLWRDYLLKKMNLQNRNRIMIYLWDTISFASFKLPVYWVNTWIWWAEIDEILKSSITILLISWMLWWPYWLYLDMIKNIIWCRNDITESVKDMTRDEVLELIRRQPYFW